MSVQIKVISSLEKVFLDEELTAPAHIKGSALRGERYSFQIACRLTDGESMRVCARVHSTIHANIELYEVGQAPVTFPAFSNHDNDYLRTVPGLFPDPLYPHHGEMHLVNGQWRCFWVTVEVSENAAAGLFPITVWLNPVDNAGETLAEAVFQLEVIPAALPEQKLIHTEWFHTDCLASYYHVPVFSEEHWNIIKNYMTNAARFGINMLLTPVFTPPLDTEVGGERPTVQLVDVMIKKGKLSFSFEKLARYMELAEQCGIRYFEISHLFTQWGAMSAPKIVAEADGETKKIFGWETSAISKEYVAFLNAFLKELRSYLTSCGRLERCYFHISDEPNSTVLENYKIASESVRDALSGCNIIDALSDYDFYEKGIIKKPIPSNDHVQTFIDHGVKNLWTYYCCGQGVKVSNRFMAMPSYRNRILGYQLFKYRIEGFLHWGFNFWFSQYSRGLINPYLETGANNAFPAGDAFLVYPGADGQPVPSLREFVFCEGLQDLRALQLLETVMPFDDIIKLLEKEAVLTFSEYPRGSEWILSKREKINQLIKEEFNK